ncbi:DUF1653 domain-containing protein [Aliikangiella marina]|uniref:DUF1653 domain-containing protein n=1 Tax=Aliikangiella marina TaxID=1712262 RepID=A0A545TCZ4_9GAMM|nr:DUF1653 domain-containing protein [Aliikangiella marina]TQV75079.1 DUF1653 domain-containing protein [Aliikangiella marina]
MASNLDQREQLKGRYRHYKGAEYIVLGTAYHSETEELMVVYQPDYGDKKLWVRPFDMFNETIEVAGKQVKRFSLIDQK